MKKTGAVSASAILDRTLIPSNAGIYLEAEGFAEKGGWVVDHQAFEKIGSAYLMAHGMGEPVADAVTKVNFPEAGRYHVFVHTCNWTSPWYAGKGPGKWKISINGTELPNVLGETGKKWEWQYAGTADISGKEATVALRDLTGFNGRVNAVYFSKENIPPPENPEGLESFRKKFPCFAVTENVPEADLVIVGGGLSGCAAALAAARLNLKVVLINNRPVIGGNNSPECRVGISGAMNQNLYPKIGNILRELTGIPIPENSHLEEHIPDARRGHHSPMKRGMDHATNALRMRILSSEKNLRLYMNEHVYKAEKSGGNIVSVTSRNIQTGKDSRFAGKLFADCTGDGNIGFLAGADYLEGRESRTFANEPSAPPEADKMCMGTSLFWNSIDTGSPVSFPTLKELPWAMQCTGESFVDTPKSTWRWETGFMFDNAVEGELIRDNMLRAIYGNWAYQKENLEKYCNFKLAEVGYIGAKRESRRLTGDIILNENDLTKPVTYPDASFTATWTVDLHYADKRNAKYFPGWEWQSYCSQPEIQPYHVPYRVLYSRNIGNLFMGGRCMSATHVALGTVRVQSTTGMAGEVLGMAAAICIRNKAAPREVYTKHLDDLKALMSKGL